MASTAAVCFVFFVPAHDFPALHHFRFLQQNLPVFISFLYFKSFTSSKAGRLLNCGAGGQFWAVFSMSACECWLHVEWIMNELCLKLEMGHLRGQHNRAGVDFPFFFLLYQLDGL